MKNSKMLILKGTCILLILATIATFFMNWITISNIRAKPLIEAKKEAINSVEDVKARLLNSTAIKRDVFAENGLSLDRTSIKKLASSVKSSISDIMDAKISPWELFKLSIVGSMISNVSRKLANIKESEDLFIAARMPYTYLDYLNFHEGYNRYYFVFPVYVLFLLVIFATAVLDAVFLILKKRKCFNIVLIVLVALHTALFVIIVIYGNAALPVIVGIPDKAKLTLSLLPFIAVILPIISLVVRSKLLAKPE